MKRFIYGFILGAVLASVVTAIAALPDGRQARERAKFLTDSNGNIAVRAVIVSE
jgi:gas vesicle protein